MWAGLRFLAGAAILAEMGGQEAPRVWQAGGSAGASVCARTARGAEHGRTHAGVRAGGAREKKRDAA
jgi:hypothetical protein